jgi:hypothetical protein
MGGRANALFISTTMLLLLGACAPPPPGPGAVRLRSEDPDAALAAMVVKYDCKAPNNLPAPQPPFSTPSFNRTFVPQIVPSASACTPATGVPQGQTCSQQVWKVSATYDGGFTPWFTVRGIEKDVPFGEIECPCECVNVDPCAGGPGQPGGHGVCRNQFSNGSPK